MSLRTYLFGIFVATILCWGAFLLTLFNTNPHIAGGIAVVSLLLSLFFALLGTFTLLGFYSRIFFSKNELLYTNIGISFRQGILFSFIIVGLLLLSHFQFLNFWTALLFILAISSLEFYFRTK